MAERWRSRAWQVLAERDLRRPVTAVVDAVLLLAIAVLVATAALRTLPGLDDGGIQGLARLAGLAVLVFGLEYLARLWVAPEAHPDDAARPWRARRRYVVSFLGLVDLAVVLPQLLGWLLPIAPDPLAIAGLLALLKLARYAPGLPLVAAVLRNEARALLAGLLVMLVLLMLAAGVMYLLERAAQPTVFRSIPHSMWWAIVTIASVGYGDMTPVTAAGRIFGGFVMLLGIAMFAVPAGILATGFAAEIRKRDFVVTWHTVARVPLFAGLDASRIAGIARLLKPQIVPAGQVLVRRGSAADAMFFIMSGEVEVDLLPQPVTLHKGQYFGEIGLLRDSQRTATVTARTECQLLALEVADFRRMMAENPDLEARIRQVAEERLRQAAPPPGAPPAQS